jgi:hypothetical protein
MHNNAIDKVSLNRLVSMTGLLFVIYYSCYSIGADISFIELVNKTCPLILMFACLWTGYRLIQKSNLMIWSPMPWFLFVCALYFGFGPLVYHFGTPESIWYMDRYYAVDEIGLLKTNMLNTVGILFTVLGFLGSNLLLSRNTANFSQDRQDINVKLTKQFLVFLLAIGLPVKYFLFLPHHFGLLNWVLPGSIQYLSIFTSLSIIVLFVLVARGERQYRLSLYILITSELIVGLMTLAKIELIMTCLMIILGLFISRPRMLFLIAGSLMVLLLYAFLSPFVTYARLSFSVTGIDNIGELSGSIQQYAQSDKDEVAALLTPGVQGWWTRFAYANSQSFAMDSYDDGNPGDSFSKAIYVFVPRLLFPDKPLMSSISGDFNKMVTGNEESYSCPGVFAEAYWNGGWPLLIAACFFIGITFMPVSLLSMQYIRRGNLAILPCAYAGIMMGLRPDNWFVMVYVGSIVQIIVLYYILSILGFFPKSRITPVLT